MGERDPGLAPPSPAAPPWGGWVVLALALAALLALVVAVGPPGGAEAAGRPLIARLLLAALAPLGPALGPALLGVLMLAVSAALAGRALEQRIGASAPLLVGLLIFGSGAWALVWSGGGELVGLALAVTAFAVAYGGGEEEAPGELYRPPQAGGRAALRWLAVGLLLAELVPISPLLAALMVPAALGVPPEARRAGRLALVGGWAAGVALELAIQGPEGVAGPLLTGLDAYRFSPAAVGWNLLYLPLGRNVGLVAGYAPLLLLLALGRGAATRPTLVPVCLTVALAGAVALPFDFAAGWLSLPFLPLYGALWLLPARPPRGWEWLAVTLVCGLLSWPLWTPRGVARAVDGAELAASWPRRLLPYESTLRTLPDLGETRLGRDDLRLRAVSGCRLVEESGRFELAGAAPAELWLAAPVDLEMVALEFGPGAPSSLTLSGAELGRTVFRPDGRVGFEIHLTRPRARHAMGFGEGRFAGHLITVRLPGRGEQAAPLRFRVLAEQP